MFPISVWRVVWAEFLVFRDATNKWGQLVVDGDEVRFYTNIGRAVTGDDGCAAVAIKRGYHHPRLYFLDTAKWFLGPWTDKRSTPPIAALTEFFHADAETNVDPLSISWYFISSLWRYQCSCTHTMPMLRSIADAVSSGSWPILFKILTLNVAMYCAFTFK